MPTQLTDPIVKRAATHVTVDHWGLYLTRGADGLLVEPIDAVLKVEANLRDGDGKVLEVLRFERAASMLPQNLRTAARDFHALLTQALRNAGMIPPGVDSDDIPGD